MKYFSVIIILLLSMKSIAQMSFSPIGTTYNNESYGPIVGQSGLETIVSVGDTFINGLATRKMQITDKRKEHFDGPLILSKRDMYIRENKDSIFIDNAFRYYLGGKQKDTTFMNTQAWGRGYMVLDSIRYINIFSALRKVFYLKFGTSECRDYTYVTFVDKYGPINFCIECDPFFPCEVLVGVPTTSYRCGTLEGNAYPEGACITLATTKEQEQLKVKLYPVPSSDEINIEMEGINSRVIEIHNSLGEKMDLFNSSVSYLNYNANISKFPAGIYQIRISDNTPLGTILRFIKQ